MALSSGSAPPCLSPKGHKPGAEPFQGQKVELALLKGAGPLLCSRSLSSSALHVVLVPGWTDLSTSPHGPVWEDLISSRGELDRAGTDAGSFQTQTAPRPTQAPAIAATWSRAVIRPKCAVKRRLQAEVINLTTPLDGPTRPFDNAARISGDTTRSSIHLTLLATLLDDDRHDHITPISRLGMAAFDPLQLDG
jgi:hypothetical protein